LRCIRVLYLALLVVCLTLFNGCGSSLLNFCRPKPSISSISPSTVKPGTADFTLVITGNDLHSDSTVSLNGTVVASTTQSANQMSATVPASMVISPATITVLVNSPPGGGSATSPTGCGGGASNTLTLTVAP
jgi:hypothetical protein